MKLQTESLKKEMIAWRHEFHKYPELGFQEVRTSKLIAELLRSFGLKVYEKFGKTGVVGHLERNKAKKLIAIRADIDALPIEEKTSLSYQSQRNGTMHACGHDGHTATLLGAAKYLSQDKSFDGNILFIFQPDEENGGGAKAMIEDNLFKKFSVSEVYALHNMPGMPVGYFATRENTITASENSFEIEVISKGGHSALPNMGGDAIQIASQIVNSLQTIVSRKIDPRKKAVLSITEFITNGKKNILASKVVLKGDTRCLDDDTKAIIESELRRICQSITAASDASCVVKFETNVPITYNSKAPTQNLTKCVIDTFGKKNIESNCAPMLFSEDFSFLASQVPGCFVLIGNGSNGPNAEPLHSPKFDFNDEILTLGSCLWVNLAKMISKH
ncbi:MAG: amidohydrolase [Paracoccaceae bacterium]|nr:amidohydrolase [Paracoccaceae bacterium]